MTFFLDYWSQLHVCQHLRVEPVFCIVLLWPKISPLTDAHSLILLWTVCDGRGGKGQDNLFSWWLTLPVTEALHQLGCDINQCSPCRLKRRVIQFSFQIFRCFNLHMVSTKQPDYQKATKELSPSIKFLFKTSMSFILKTVFFNFFPISFCHLSSTIQHNQILIIGLGWFGAFSRCHMIVVHHTVQK